jgi:hypothetical protein
MKVLRKLLGLTTAALFMGITTHAVLSDVSAEEAKQTAAWSLPDEEQNLLNGWRMGVPPLHHRWIHRDGQR